jgi:NACHT domain
VTVFGHGSLLQTHPKIITPRRVLTPRGPINGSLKTPSSRIGSRVVPFCGFMENVRRSSHHLTHIADGIFDLIAGSGKTVIWFVVTDRSHHVELTQSNSSTIIQHFMALHNAGRASVVHFYFDFQDRNKQSYQDLLHSLLIQLSAQSDYRLDALYRLHTNHDHGTRLPSDAAMMECLKTMLSTTGQNPTYIIIDALDECPHTSGNTSPRALVLNLLKKLVELRLPNLYVCVTSRAKPDIRRVLESLTQNRLSITKMGDRNTSTVKSTLWFIRTRRRGNGRR